MGTFAVVFTDDHRPDLEAFAPVLADLLGLSAIDARLRIRKGRGIFLEQLDEAAARRVAEALGANGWTAEAVPQESLVRLPGRPVRLFQVDGGGDAFRYKRNVAEPFRDVPWDAIRLVHAGLVATPQYRDFLQSKTFQFLPAMYRIDDPEARAQLRRAMARKALQRDDAALSAAPVPAENKPLAPETLSALCREQTDAYLDLLVDGQPAFLRADRRQVVLDYLGARGEGNSLENFKRLVADVASRAARAEVTPLTRRLLEGGDPPTLVFDDAAEHERYVAWRCFRLGLVPAAGKLPAPADTPPLPEDLAVTACPRCGTVIEAGAARCAYCKGSLRPPRRPLFWKLFLPVVLVWALGLAAAWVILERGRRQEAIERVQHHSMPAAPGAPRKTIEAAILEDLRADRDRRPAGWSVSRRPGGAYEVAFSILRRKFDGTFEFEKLAFVVDLDAADVWALNEEAARYLPPRPPPGAKPDPPPPPAPKE